MQDTLGAAQIELDKAAGALHPRADILRNGAMVALGTLLTLSIYGYRFGEGNHTIYLLDPLRRTHRELLRSDWFTTQTLQYHAVFGWITHKLMQWNVVEPAFLAGYVLLVVLFHLAWLGIAKQLSQTMAAYVLAMVLFYASAAGTGLGFYQFFQDSSVLASNVANVALLWGIYLWIAGRFTGSGLCFGVAGLVHLNHALVGAGMWVVLCLLQVYRRDRNDLPGRTIRAGRNTLLIGSALAIIPALTNLALAFGAKTQRSRAMPLAEFIDIYVRLRHPHHYDPSSWSVWLWMSFLWPIPVALVWLWRRPDVAICRMKRIFLILLGLQPVVLLGAGIWYISETLVQMSLWRFSIFAQLLACTAVAAWVTQRAPLRAPAAILASAACAAMLIVSAVRGPFFGAYVIHEDDTEYHELCDWARRHTPLDAIFLVSPAESSFRLRAKRAIVVNFKAVPQLSGELRHWRDRMRDALDINDLRTLPRGYTATLFAIEQRYASLGADQLIAIARKYRARFIVTSQALHPHRHLQLNFSTARGKYFLYDAGEAEGGAMSDEELRRMMLDQFGLRIGDHMTQYVKQMLSGAQQEIAVMGLDARTGVAVRRIIALRSPSEAQPATTASSNFVAR